MGIYHRPRQLRIYSKLFYFLKKKSACHRRVIDAVTSSLPCYSFLYLYLLQERRKEQIGNQPASRYRYAYTRVVDRIDYKARSTAHCISHRLADNA